MLIEADAKQLEWLCAAYLSKDKVAYKEILNGEDLHSNNQQRLNLPTRLVAKTFLFRLIYGGSAFAYAHDPEFTDISTSDKFWQRVIDEFYSKYQELERWHSNLVREVVRNQQLTMLTGRIYKYERDERGQWPRTTILNYPVQGLGADLMAIGRCSLFSRIKKKAIACKFISTVHDSIIIDSPDNNVKEIVGIIQEVWKDIPRNFEKLFGVPFDLPCIVEIKVGKDWGNILELKNAN